MLFHHFNNGWSGLDTDADIYAGGWSAADAFEMFLQGWELAHVQEQAQIQAQTTAPQPIYIDAGTSAAQLNSIIATADDNAEIILRNGTHVFDQAITITRDNITLRGESETGTIVKFAFAAGAQDNGIEVTGGSKVYVGVADGAISKGDDTITLNPGHGLAAGDMVYIYQANTQQYLDDNGWTNVSWDDADTRPFREAVLKVESVSGNTVTFNHPVPYDMDAGAAKVFTFDAAENVALSDMTITYDLGTANPYDFVNAAAVFSGTSAIDLTATWGASLSGLSIIDTASNGVSINTSIDLTGDDIFVSGSHNKGGGGNGYGIELHEASFNTLTNLDLQDLRHSLVFSAWNAENDNTIHIANTNRDINFHGSPDSGNTVTVDYAALDYDPSQNTSGSNAIWKMVASGGASHAATDIWGENSVAFSHGEASSANDIIYGADGGAYLNGKFGYDTLVGGNGDDLIVGGARKDTLTGGEGADTFLFRMGDDLDTVTDFQFGPGGDTLIFANNPSVTDFSDLTITQSGNNVRIRYGSNSTIVLNDHIVADVDATNIQYDPTGTLTAHDYFGIDF